MRQARLIPVFMAMTVVMLLAATPAILQLRIFWWKHQIAERLEQTCLKTIHLSKQNVRWEEEGKELRIGQRLFDVDSYRETEQELIATGIFDDEETSIEAQANDFWEQGSSQQTDVLLKYFQLLNGTCFIQDAWHLAPLSFSANHYTGTLFILINSVYLSIPSPPPQEISIIYST